MSHCCSALQQIQLHAPQQQQQPKQAQPQEQETAAMEVEETGITQGMIQRMLSLSQTYNNNNIVGITIYLCIYSLFFFVFFVLH